MPGTDSINNTSSEDTSASAPQRQLSQDGTEIIPTRMSKVTTPKPASNPLQFIKTGPCDLYKAAQEQIKKVEEIKKVEKVKDDDEDWQSNLDSWKCSRRKRQEHIIERVVEVKKLELEEHDRNRRRSKTFNEMMEERSSKGGLRKMSILSYSEEDTNDLTALGISNNKEKSNDEISTDSNQNGSNNNHNSSSNDVINHYKSSCNETDLSNSNGHSAAVYDRGSSTPVTVSSPEPEEYTYERAIQGYMNFAEAKVKTSIKNSNASNKNVGGTVNFKIGSMKKDTGGKIGEKLTELEQIRLRSKSTNDINGAAEAKELPKVDVNKRRSLFENAESIDNSSSKSSDRVSKDLSKMINIKERVLNLEKKKENYAKINRLSGEMAPHIKDTISNLEKQKVVEAQTEKRLSTADISPQISIKERLNSLERQNEADGTIKNRNFSDDIHSVSIKERMSSFDPSANKEVSTKLTLERDSGFKEKLETFRSTEKSQNEILENTPNTCSVNKQINANRLERLQTEEEILDSETEFDGKQFDGKINENFEQPTTQSIVGEASLNAKTELIENVSSVQIDSSLNTERVATLEGCGDGTRKLQDIVNEPEFIKKVHAVVFTREKNTNKETREPDIVSVQEKEGIRTCSSQTDVTHEPSLQTSCDISKTIVTQISLPDHQTSSCPRVNISVSIDSVSKELPSVREDEALDELPDDIRHSLCRDLITVNKPRTRVRKLTPILTTPNISAAPLKTVCELQIIEETETSDRAEEEQTGVQDMEIHMSPRRPQFDSCQNENEVQEILTSTISVDIAEEEETQESAVYGDENIDEVLGKCDEIETVVDDETQFDVINDKKEIETKLETSEVLPLKKADVLEEPYSFSGNYENVYISNQVPHLRATPDAIIYSTLSFPLGSRPTIEPPKEKPPPPPLELSDDESAKPELPPKPSLRRLDSTKRIKKEIRKKRSDFLGIEGCNDDSYLEPEIYVPPPPDMMTFLQEERRLEQQLYRQSICSESDSNHETAESRDSGVELDRGHVDDICWSKPDVLSEPHSRQNSETFGNTSITSEEDEMLKKEREIIEVLEKEEQWRFGSKNSHSAEQEDLGEKLAVKLRQLEHEKMQLERERAEEEGRRKAEETTRRQNEQRLIAKQQQLLEQESSPFNTDSGVGEEALRFERERLHKEQEHLERCRQNLMVQQTPDPIDIHYSGSRSQWDTPSNRHSLQEVPIGVPIVDVPRHSMQDVSQSPYQQISSGYRYSLPDLQQRESRSARPPPPVLLPKPVITTDQEQWERESRMRGNRIPSADNIPLQIENSTKLRHGSSVPAVNLSHGGQQMTKSTLHALSATPRPRIISTENWIQPKKKLDVLKSNYNYQHWLIQEAEHRRILEHQQKVSQQLKSKRNLPYNGQPPIYGGSPPSHHTVGLPISPSVQGQASPKWIPSPRTEKPLPDSVIQTLTQRVQSRDNKTSRRRNDGASFPNEISPSSTDSIASINLPAQSQERMLSVSGKKKCSHCYEELGRGAAMIIESLQLFYHIDCFKCCVCHVQLGDGLMGTDVRVRNNKLHCHNCYSSDDGVKFSCV